MIAFIERVIAFFTACITFLAGILGIGGENIGNRAENFRVTAYV